MQPMPKRRHQGDRIARCCRWPSNSPPPHVYRCGQRFTTYERIERPQLIVIKNDGKRELFNRAKLLNGLYRACEKTAVT